MSFVSYEYVYVALDTAVATSATATSIHTQFLIILIISTKIIFTFRYSTCRFSNFFPIEFNKIHIITFSSSVFIYSTPSILNHFLILIFLHLKFILFHFSLPLINNILLQHVLPYYNRPSCCNVFNPFNSISHQPSTCSNQLI